MKLFKNNINIIFKYIHILFLLYIHIYIIKMKLLFLILGGSFRKGNSQNRNYGIEESINGQITASNSHIEFIEFIKNKFNVEIDVIISTYSTNYDNILLDIYKEYLIENYFYKFNSESDLKGIHNLFHLAYKNHIENYDALFFFRIDIYLKKRLFDIFNPYSETILFPFIVSVYNITSGHLDHKNPSGHPVHSDMLLFIPKKYFNVINKINLGHATWSELVGGCYGFFYNDVPILTYDDFNCMIDTHHDSDSKIDWNPLYYTVNREECPEEKWNDPESRFNINNYNCNLIK